MHVLLNRGSVFPHRNQIDAKTSPEITTVAKIRKITAMFNVAQVYDLILPLIEVLQ